ncbi:MAG: hypothetical protein KAS32_15820 [Candidatus Peribacteraceae bacterium]|nr:hypothetical protein [Candidatus Peribacteraceae bacterium]
MSDIFAHAIGNSHSIYFGTYFKNFRCYNVGATLAYSLGQDKVSKTNGKAHVLEILKFIKHDEQIIFTFGEIDCRAHLLKQVKTQNSSIQQVTEACAKSYMKFINEIKEMGYNNIMIWGIPASSSDILPPVKRYPRIGSCKDRNKTTEELNNRIEEKCVKLGCQFISIFPYLIDENYETKPEFYTDGVHLGGNSAKLTAEEFKKHGHDTTVKFNKRPESIKGFYSRKKKPIKIARNLQERSISYEQALSEVNFYIWKFSVLSKGILAADVHHAELVKEELKLLYGEK